MDQKGVNAQRRDQRDLPRGAPSTALASGLDISDALVRQRGPAAVAIQRLIFENSEKYPDPACHRQVIPGVTSGVGGHVAWNRLWRAGIAQVRV